MSTTNWITISGIATGFTVTIIGSVWHLSHQIGGLTEKVVSIERTVEKLDDRTARMQGELNEVRVGVRGMQVKLDVLWRTHLVKSDSTVILSKVGIDMLKRSGIGSFADQHYSEILSRVRALKPDNAHQTQELVISVINQYKTDSEYRLKLYEAALSGNYDIDSLLFVAALSIKDRVIEDLGFSKDIR